jgi:hypothetical protein
VRPSKQTLFELFDRQRRYAVPLFQRPYVWSRDDQWEPLWEDITAKYADVQRDGRQVRPHFLGAVVLEQVRTFGTSVDMTNVIDGQQRLTTFQIFLAALRDVVREAGDTRLADELLRLTKNTGLRSDDENEEFKVWPTNADRTVYSTVVRAGSRAGVEKVHPPVVRRRNLQPRPPLVEAYLYFHEQITRLARGQGGTWTVAAFGILFEVIKRHLELVVIELEDSDDAQVIFETLNARGAPLLASDLVRNFVFLNASRQGKDPESLYDRLWKEYDEQPEPGRADARFWKVEQKQGRIKRPRLDLFLLHYVSCRTESEVPAGQLFEEFRSYWRRVAERDTEVELVEQRRYSTSFASLLAPDESTRVGLFARRLETIDTSTVYPLLLHLLVEVRERLPLGDLDKIVVDLESFLVRRMICGLTSKNYNRLFVTLLREVRAAGPKGAAAKVREVLLAGSGEAVKWPEDREFERSWLGDPAYRWLKPHRVEMILLALDRAQQTAKRERISIEQDLTVEHVMPGKWAQHWPPPDPSLASGDDTAEERRDVLLHTFGNLTLITGALNASISDGPYEPKRAEIALKSALVLNTWFQKQMTWNEEEIHRRGKALVEIAKTVWPRPSAQAA